MELNDSGTEVSLAIRESAGRYRLQKSRVDDPNLIDIVRKKYAGAYYERLPNAHELLDACAVESSSEFALTSWVWANLRKEDGSPLTTLVNDAKASAALEFSLMPYAKDFSSLHSRLLFIEDLTLLYVLVSVRRHRGQDSLRIIKGVETQEITRNLAGLLNLSCVLSAAIYGARMQSDGGVCVADKYFTPDAVEELENSFGILFQVA